MICVVAGLMIVVSSINARGTDLRPGRNTELVDLVQQQSRTNATLQDQLAEQRRSVDELTAAELPEGQGAGVDQELAQQAGLTALSGPGVSVELTDAPLEVAPPGVEGDLLVVHQQDIQSVVNAMWAGGAEAMSIQGQRVISTTGIKCVGNTVVLHGIPYSPPYVITAIGDQGRMEASLKGSSYLEVYRQYVLAYGLGYQQRRVSSADLPAYEGSTKLRWARAGVPR